MPKSINKLTNDQLIEVYTEAMKHQLESHFLMLLELEIERRHLEKPEIAVSDERCENSL